MNGLIKQWGTVSNTSGGTEWLTQTLAVSYNDTNYKIFLQGRYNSGLAACAVVNPTGVNANQFQYYWGQSTNLLNYITIGY